jgi:hypothetical protein
MIRMLAQTAPPDYSSELALQCFGAAEYLDCDCSAQIDPAFEQELENLPTLELPHAVIQVLARRARQMLPRVQPSHGH